MRVGDEYRTNPLSLSPGGYTVTVYFDGGSHLEYDKVKRPGSYIRMIEKKSGKITRIDVDGVISWSQQDGDKYKILDKFR
jgi:hypothetical protein